MRDLFCLTWTTRHAVADELARHLSEYSLPVTGRSTVTHPGPANQDDLPEAVVCGRVILLLAAIADKGHVPPLRAVATDSRSFTRYRIAAMNALLRLRVELPPEDLAPALHDPWFFE